MSARVKGFSLTELLIVLAVIGIVAAVLPFWSDVRVGLRSTTGNRVAGESLLEGSNPSHSVPSLRAKRLRAPFNGCVTGDPDVSCATGRSMSF